MIFRTLNAVKQIKKLLMKKRYNAPTVYAVTPVAMPYPAVQRGGMRAVAIATPGMTFPPSLRVIPMMPASPPKTAIKTSQMVGDVRASSSDEGVAMGVREK